MQPGLAGRRIGEEGSRLQNHTEERIYEFSCSIAQLEGEKTK